MCWSLTLLCLLPESTGVFRNPSCMHTAILKSYQDTMEAAQKVQSLRCKADCFASLWYFCRRILTADIFDMYIEARKMREILFSKRQTKGFPGIRFLKKFEEEYWSEERATSQPKAAFLENSRYVIKHILEVFKNV